MNLKQLKHLVELGESETVEFKKSTAQLVSAFETVSSFLNAKGGTVLVGVTNEGKILGQQVADKTKQDIATEISKVTPPAQTQITVGYVPVGKGLDVIVLKVLPGSHLPYTYDDRPYQRTQSSTSRMSQHRYEQLIVARGQLNHVWDEQLASKYKIDDLDHEEIRRTVLSGISHRRIANEVLNYDAKQILHYLDLLKDGAVTNAAVVLYAKKMQTLYSHCEIRMTRYRGNDKLGDFIDSNHVSGNAFKLLLEADFFIMRHLPVASFFDLDKGARRIDKPALPVLAIREALLNAICHRDYAIRNSSIALAIFDDRLEIWNNGILSPQLRLGDLKKRHDSYPRNKKIAAVFRSSGWVEKAGVGTTRMIDECKSFGIPAPEFEEYSSGLAVIFKFKEPIGVSVSKSSGKHELSARQQNVLEIIRKHHGANLQLLIAGIGATSAKRTIQKELHNLKNMKLINYKGKGKAIVWFIV